MNAERTGLDRLLARFPEAVVAYVESQSGDVLRARAEDVLPLEVAPGTYPGPWTLVDLWEGEGLERFAIWRYTGAVYRIGADGAAEDEPFIDR